MSSSTSNELEVLSSGDNVVENLNRDSPFTLRSPPSTLRIISWGHRRGPLLPAPLLSIDLRKLPNPPKQTRDNHTGVSKTLREWLFSNDTVRQRFEDACLEIRRKLNEADANGDRAVTVGVNCELGRHRSVAFVEEMGRMKWDGWDVVIEHRDVNARHSQRKRRKGAVDRTDYADE